MDGIKGNRYSDLAKLRNLIPVIWLILLRETAVQMRASIYEEKHKETKQC